ncbi:CLUMA_CG003631, isoform A [Clunio marinus]|uniref:CLUMA_CG003631, isoform A n=1 Tax=Clunio marinus TaxID=568069 RepID=A0A1J1HPK8_9DIPT|nr:CLUMA_CG003631, isoform A [Clunio marinus]
MLSLSKWLDRYESTEESTEHDTEDEEGVMYEDNVVIDEIEIIDIKRKSTKENSTLKPAFHETLESVKNLCRVCSSKGFISISSNITRNYFKIRPSSDKRLWNKTIGEIIAEVSGEKVSPNDTLPQFICQHCLGYLQHAFEMRLRIRSNAANLRTCLAEKEGESLHLETSQIDQRKITKREIEELEDETNEDGHFIDQFHGANITISSNPYKPTVNRVLEHNCPSCKKRMMSVQSLNEHTEVCEISILDSFFTSFKQIYTLRFRFQITTKEFVLHAIKMIIDTHNKLKQIIEINNIDTNSITTEIPQLDENLQLKPHKHFSRRNHLSPDYGYMSGDRQCYSHR